MINNIRNTVAVMAPHASLAADGRSVGTVAKQPSFAKSALIVDYAGITRRLVGQANTALPVEEASRVIMGELKGVSADAKAQGFVDADRAAGRLRSSDLMTAALRRAFPSMQPTDDNAYGETDE